MRDSILTSTKNPTIKHIRKLKRSRERKKQNLLLLEGNNLLVSALNSDLSLVTVFCTPKWRERHPQLISELNRGSQEIQLVSPEVLASLATTVNPDGVIAIARRNLANKDFGSENLTQKLGSGSSKEQIQLGLAVEMLQDPGNLGTIIRTAVATDVDRLWLSQDSVDPDHPKVLRASVGEWFRLPMTITPSLRDVVKQQKQQGTQVIATVPQSDLTYWQLDLTLPSLLLIGNEGAGLSSELMALADNKVSIPLANQVESLNAAIATALVLYEAQRQYEAKAE